MFADDLINNGENQLEGENVIANQTEVEKVSAEDELWEESSEPDEEG
ncbi:MAG: hypothetical protein GXY86_10960 [Firmicutes bacterium]|nr:hypothetical protein [Bacillota bacterium]